MHLHHLKGPSESGLPGPPQLVYPIPPHGLLSCHPGITVAPLSHSIAFCLRGFVLSISPPGIAPSRRAAWFALPPPSGHHSLRPALTTTSPCFHHLALPYSHPSEWITIQLIMYLVCLPSPVECKPSKGKGFGVCLAPFCTPRA